MSLGFRDIRKKSNPCNFFGHYSQAGGAIIWNNLSPQG